MKNELKVEFLREAPCFEKISTFELAISTTLLGPAATWGSGAVGGGVSLAFSRIPSSRANMLAGGEVSVAAFGTDMVGVRFLESRVA